MKKLAFTIGDFDCINQDHLHLIKEMRKVVMPDNEVVVVLMDDYTSFVMTKKFPIQDFERRANNLHFFIKDVRGCYCENPEATFAAVLNHAKQVGARPIFVAYDDNKEFKGRDVLKKYNVPIRFIKRPNYAK
jgi:glycerol-3-phosphate cytidylyltransferase-like family protein